QERHAPRMCEAACDRLDCEIADDLAAASVLRRRAGNARENNAERQGSPESPTRPIASHCASDRAGGPLMQEDAPSGHSACSAAKSPLALGRSVSPRAIRILKTSGLAAKGRALQRKKAAFGGYS